MAVFELYIQTSANANHLILWAQSTVCAHTYADRIAFMYLLLLLSQLPSIFLFCFNVKAFAEV